MTETRSLLIRLPSIGGAYAVFRVFTWLTLQPFRTRGRNDAIDIGRGLAAALREGQLSAVRRYVNRIRPRRSEQVSAEREQTEAI